MNKLDQSKGAQTSHKAFPRESTFFIFLILILISSVSCRRLPQIQSANEIFSESKPFTYLDTRFKLSYRSEAQSLNAKVKLRLKRDSLLWMSITGPVGVEGIRAKVVQDSIYLIDRINKTYNETGLDTLKNLLNFPVNYQMLEAILLGNMPFASEPDDELSQEGRLVKIQQVRQNLLIQNYLNTRSKKTERIFFKDLSNQNSLNVVYEDFKKVQGIMFPVKSDITARYFDRQGKKTEEVQIKINHSKTQITQEKISFPFSVPSKYRNNSN